MLQKNESIQLTITGMTAEGNGVGRYEEEGGDGGFVVFVPYTAVGDRIRCRIVKVKPAFAYGRVEEILDPSPDRLGEEREEDACPVFGRCGGCTFRHIAYEAELRYKWERVRDALQRLGGLTLEPEPIVGADSCGRYRNKAQYPVVPGEHRALIGLYAQRSHRVVEQHDCRLQPEVFRDIVDIVARWIKKEAVPVYDEGTGQGLLRHLYVREAEATGEIMVCLVCTSGKLPGTKSLIAALTDAVPAIVSVVVNINRQDTNVVLGEEGYTLWGRDAISDELCGLRFRLSPRSFYQVNRRQAERLYRLAGEAAALTGGETVLDLYCGTGTIGLTMAGQAAQVIGVETVPEAVADARRNAADNGITNARFLLADAAGALRQLREEGSAPHVVVLDPPRKGCAAEVVEAVAALAPERIVYVSCDPATLARDCRLFADKGYAVRRVTPLDMFPRTPHVECVAMLTKG